MKPEKDISKNDLIFSLRRLAQVSREVAYAKSPEDSELFTVQYLRPALEQAETLLSSMYRNENIHPDVRRSGQSSIQR